MLAKVGHINQQARQTELTTVDIENLNYAYDISTESGSTPDWMPKEVFDDGKKTYINFPENIGTTKRRRYSFETGMAKPIWSTIVSKAISNCRSSL